MSIWNHKKHKGNWTGSYNRTKKKNERVFELTNGKKTITWESHQKAKDAGWVRIPKWRVPKRREMK